MTATTAPAAPTASPAPDTRAAPEGLRMPSGRTWTDIAVLLTLTAIGVIGFAPSFGGIGFLVAGLGGVVLGAATGVLTSMLRLGGVLTTAAAVIGYFLVGTAVAVPTQALFFVLPTLQSLASIAVGTAYGWTDIVTLSTPIGAPAYIGVVPYAAAWLVALVATTLATRWLSVRPRTAWRFGVALVGPVLLYLGGILIGTDEPFQAGARGIGFAIIAMVWIGWRRPVGGVAEGAARRLRSRKLAGTAIILVGAVLVGGAGGFLLAPPQDQRLVLREEIEPPFDPLDYPSPLAGFRHYTKQVTDEHLFTVSGLQPGDRVRIATLDSFTGKLWNVTGPEASADGSGSFELVGRSLPDPSFITPETRRGVSFEIAGYDDVWVPGVGYPTDLRFTDGEAAERTDDLRYNAATGALVLTSRLSEGDRYTLDAQVQRPIPLEELRGVTSASVELPPVMSSPDIVASTAQELAGSASDPSEQLEAIRIALAEDGYLSHGRASDTVPSRAGHGADRIIELLERPQLVGDEEQYASAFALMARSLGHPARVVMGFAPEIPEGAAAVEVTGEDVTAWVEVAFRDVGWVAFDPTPDETDIPQDQVPQPQSEPQPQVRQPPRADHDEEDLLSPVELEEQDEDDDGLGFVLPGWVIVVGLSLLIPAAIVFAPMLVVALVKARRMRRRRSAEGEHDRLAGAWVELADRFSELGFDVPGRVTRPLVATSLERQLAVGAADGPPVRLRPLAAAADEAVFSGREVSREESETAWRSALEAVSAASTTLPRSRRLLSRYRVRSARDLVARLGSSTRQESR